MEKRLERLVRLLQKNQRYRLALVGEGPAEKFLRNEFKNYRVKFMGIDLSKAFASADVFVMPSNTETLGFVVMEALASGVPAVGVRAGGLVDIIEDGITGYLVSDQDDMEEFDRKVKDLVDDRELRKLMGQRARQGALNWSWQVATEYLRTVQYPIAIANHFSRNLHDKGYDQDLCQAISDRNSST